MGRSSVRTDARIAGPMQRKPSKKPAKTLIRRAADTCAHPFGARIWLESFFPDCGARAMDVPVLDFKSATLYAIRVVLHSADTLALRTALDARMKEAAGFFDDEPVVIDAGRI